jgi:hypothetical protein
LGLVRALDQLVSITDQLAQAVNLVGHTATLAPVKIAYPSDSRRSSRSRRIPNPRRRAHT